MINYQEEIQDDLLKMKAGFECSGDYMSGVGDGIWNLFNRIYTDETDDLLQKVIRARVFNVAHRQNKVG